MGILLTLASMESYLIVFIYYNMAVVVVWYEKNDEVVVVVDIFRGVKL